MKHCNIQTIRQHKKKYSKRKEKHGWTQMEKEKKAKGKELYLSV